MPKTFTQIPLADYQQMKPENLNKNIDKTLSSFNGTLDGHNNPVETTREQHFILPRQGAFSDTPVGADVLKLGTEYATQSYYKTRRSSSFEEVALDVFTPIATVNLDSDNWTKGFNTLTSLTDFDTFPLTFQAKEGQLVGCATIDWEHGTQVFSVQVSDNPAAFAPRSRGMQWWSEWGVFVNNILVARSGFIYPRRHTTQIPFTVPVGSQQVTIDVRFMTITVRPVGDPSLDVVTSSEFNIFSAEIWCRNQYR
jgi:hypothetical protein